MKYGQIIILTFEKVFLNQFKMVKELPQPLSNLQIELLKLYSAGISDDQLMELKELISNFLFEKSVGMADKIWVEKGYNQQTITKWLNED